MRQFRLRGGSLGLGTGIALRRTTLAPDDPANGNAGDQVRGVLDLQWQSGVGRPWRSHAFAQYTPGARNHFFTASVGRRTAHGLYVGPEVSGSGDPTYRLWGIAATVTGMKLGGFALGLQAGAQHLEGGDTQPAIGVSVVRYQD